MFDTVHHQDVLVKILKNIYLHSSLAPLLGFKGGTAAMLFYGLERFSIDLDFDMLESKQDFILNEMPKVLENYGIIKQAENKRYNLFFLLAYNNKSEHAPNIKVEINKRNFGSRYSLKEYLGIPMQVMVQEDMAAHKVLAMYNRMGEANRDIFDVWFFLNKQWPINIKIIEETTGWSYKDFLEKCIEALEKFSDRSVLQGLGELLTAKQKAWAKVHLVNDTIFLLKLQLRRYLTPQEAASML